MQILISCLLLARNLSQAAALHAEVFNPSKEWQLVPEDVQVPGGLEIRMDMTRGGRWARIPPGSKASEGNDNDLALVSSSPIDPADWDVLEDKAHDYDDGVEIVNTYGPSLCAELLSGSALSDQAGRVLAVSLRNNQDAAQALTRACPNLPDDLSALEKRSLSVVSALVSTKDGLASLNSQTVLAKIQNQLSRPGIKLDYASGKALDNLLRNLAVAGVDGESMCRWAESIQRAAISSGLPRLKELAREIVLHRGDFADLSVQCKAHTGMIATQHD